MSAARSAIAIHEAPLPVVRLRALEQACVRAIKARFTVGSLVQMANIAESTASRLVEGQQHERAAYVADLGRMARQLLEQGWPTGRREERMIAAYLRLLRTR